MSTGRHKNAIAAAAEAMRRHALSFPETHEDFPWEGDRVVKVRGKIFLFMGTATTQLSFSVKLPQSSDIALMLPFTRPTGYGLGKSGWVSGCLEGDETPPVDMLLAWIDESYRAIAPKRVVAQLAARQAAPAEAKPAKVTKSAKAAKAPARRAAANKAGGAAGKARAPAR